MRPSLAPLPRAMTTAAIDDALMQSALAQAQAAIGLTEPNPRVGCVIATAQGRVLGQGHTQAVGQAHAEVMALRDAAARGESVAGATAYVTLEPCAHFGRTPPCCDALIAAGIGRVVMALEDPFPQVAGQGAARLRAAGISVDEGLGAEAAREINIGFFSRVLRKRPWVRLKSAISLDGRTALPSGQSQWITGPAARADGHAWRKRSGAVLTGIGTVMHDDPMLDVRLVPTAKQPQRVVLDSSLRCPANARILQGSRGAWLFTTIDEAGVAASTHAQALSERGAVIISQPGKDGRLDLVNVLHDLAERGINELHVEAGPQLSGAFIAQGLVDETLIYVAPKLLGHGLPLAQLPPLAQLSDAAELRFVDACAVGEDWRLRLRPRNGFGSA